ncbi:homeobox-leucine zipper protein ATHB-15 [Dorcoceras hygrometricum]|uniref:Homeobox-leucine zipper protein ATHB-15 n=1 Tax=Dorcoceras hygrometricum TaxID=472368 RepID=A0A2Z7A2X2_9LAMI|nr:homeobox-leucine zipper protein ATHB-15 [Dorcoceras hygrometricum]
MLAAQVMRACRRLVVMLADAIDHEMPLLAARSCAMVGRDVRDAVRPLPTLLRDDARGRAPRTRPLRRASFSWRRPPADRRSGDAPANFRRCRDGWSEFF